MLNKIFVIKLKKIGEINFYNYCFLFDLNTLVVTAALI